MVSLQTQLPLSVPVIDFSSHDLKPETREWDSVRSRVRKALEEYGCFEALFDGASMELRKAMFEASEEVFDLPLETKQSTKSDLLYKGYLTIPTMPLYEGMGFFGVDNSEVVDDLTHKLWPHQGNISFSKDVQSFADKLIELSVKVRTMTMESFGLEKYIEEHLNSATNHFQLIKYRGLVDNTEDALGFHPHIDRQFISILCQNDAVDGLEIKTKDGEEWMKSNPYQASSFLVMAGASLHLLLNGRVYPPLHRVTITGKKDRYVAALFLPPKEGLMINAPDEIIDDDNPRLYKPFNFEAYLKFTNTHNKDRDLSTLKAYCAL